MDKELIKQKIHKYCEKVKNGFNNTVKWAEEHPAAAAMIVAGTGTALTKGVKYAQIYADHIHRTHDFYDPRRGLYVRTRRTPTTRELLEIDRRYKNGESYVSILADLGLTKR